MKIRSGRLADLARKSALSAAVCVAASLAALQAGCAAPAGGKHQIHADRAGQAGHGGWELVLPAGGLRAESAAASPPWHGGLSPMDAAAGWAGAPYLATAGDGPEMRRRDAMLIPPAWGPMMATTEWPTASRPDLGRVRRFTLSTREREVVYFERERRVRVDGGFGGSWGGWGGHGGGTGGLGRWGGGAMISPY